ncbi:MAG TPA: DUF6335 family protein [Methylomirabilota bacterium]|nr:DUF6335 family protein [Methylomirabilota bacterium]
MAKRKTRPGRAKRGGTRRTARRTTGNRAGGKKTGRKKTGGRSARGATARGRARKPTRATGARKPPRAKKPTRGRGDGDGDDRGQTVSLLRDVSDYHETGPAATGGDIDADWQRAQSSGEEAVGGSVSTPDQDRVDDIGHALGVEQPSDAPLRPTEEILEDRDRRYWDFERRADKRADRRHEP